MMRIGVIANCQAQSIAENLRMIPEVDDVLVLPVHLFSTHHFKEAEERFQTILNDKNAVVLTFPLKVKFKQFATEALRKSAKCKIITITNLYFSGLHPDITYVGAMGERMRSPMGDYHSKVILKSYFEGVSKEDCLQRFNEDTYKSYGFFDEFEKSRNELISRDRFVDIPFAVEFIEICLRGPNLYTMNHPAPIVFHHFTNKIADSLGLSSVNLPVEYLENHLVKSGWWPYYPEILESLGNAFSNTFIFKQPKGQGGKLLNLETFVSHSYHHYGKIENKLIKSKQVAELCNK